MDAKERIYVIDDDDAVRDSLTVQLEAAGYEVTGFASAVGFLEVAQSTSPGCVLSDVQMPDMDGMELQKRLSDMQLHFPVVIMTGHADVALAVRAMKAGAVDFLTKPMRDQDLLDAVTAAIQIDKERRQEAGQIAQLRERYASLTSRERQVATLVASGLMNKQVANELSISEVTVKTHRARAMRKLSAKSVAMLARMVDFLNIQR